MFLCTTSHCSLAQKYSLQPGSGSTGFPPALTCLRPVYSLSAFCSVTGSSHGWPALTHSSVFWAFILRVSYAQGGSRPGCIGGLSRLPWVQLGHHILWPAALPLGGMCRERHPRLCLCPVLCWTSSLEVHMGIWQVSCEYSSEKTTTRRTVPWTVLHSKSTLYFWLTGRIFLML